MSNLPKKAEDKVNIFGIVLIGIASAILIWASAVALQAYYMNTAGAMETERDQVNLSRERRSVEAAQQAMLNRLEHNAEYANAAQTCVRNPIDVAMTAVVGDAQQPNPASLVPAVGPHDKPTIAAVAGFPTADAKPQTTDGPTATVEGDTIAISARIDITADGTLVTGSGLVIAAVAAVLATDDTIAEVTINSFTDNRGVEQDLVERTQGRAERVMAELVGAEIDPARLRAVGNGSKNPVGDNATDEGRKANNRVEFVISKRAEAAPAPAPAPAPPAPAPAPAPAPNP